MKNELNKKFQYGWYGTCDEECKPLYFDDLDDRNYIESVIRVSLQDGRSFEKFTAYNKSSHSWVSSLPEGETFDDYINPQFKYMECGMGYLIVRNTDNFSHNPVIEGFTVADYDGASGGFVAVDGCPDPTPTPTPAPPYIKIGILDGFNDYSYDGNFGEVEIRFTISLSDATSWQYQISGDSNVYVIQPSGSNPVVKEIKFVETPGDYTLTVTGLDSDGKPVNVQGSTDTRAYQVLAPTPTPTVTPTVTPEKTPTPTPTQTPFNCECIPDTHETVKIQANPQFASGHTFAAFAVGSDVGINMDEFGTAAYSSVNLIAGDDVLGTIILTGKQPNSASLYVKDVNTGVCYKGTADSSNGNGQDWNVVMGIAELPEGCQPTPSPVTDCCHGKEESTVVDTIIQPHTTQYISGEVVGVTGKLCWNTITSAGTDRSFNCPIEVADWQNGGLVINCQGDLTSSNNVFRFEKSDGTCYEVTLVDSGDGVNIFQRIS